MRVGFRRAFEAVANLSEAFAVEPAILHAAIDREAVGVELAVADCDVPALVGEDEQAHSRRLLIEHVRVEDEDRIARTAFARQLAIDHDIGLAAVELAARQRHAVSNPLLGMRRVGMGTGAARLTKAAGSKSRMRNFTIDKARSPPRLPWQPGIKWLI